MERTPSISVTRESNLEEKSDVLFINDVYNNKVEKENKNLKSCENYMLKKNVKKKNRLSNQHVKPRKIRWKEL